MIIKETAYAKINLGLDILGFRADKYHEVAMVMQSVGLTDELTLEPAGELEVACDVPDLPGGPTNLAWKAAVFMGEVAGRKPNVHIHIKKRIFLEAGLAGGSADAAAVLRGLNRLWDLGLPPDKLERLGAKLGSDVPFCVQNGLSLATGRGEILEALPDFPIQTVVLAKPKVTISTPWAYREYDKRKNIVHPDIVAMVRAIRDGDTAEIWGHCGNVLEPVAAKRYPVIHDIEKVMREKGALALLMSGSGPTVFAVAQDAVAAAAMAASLETMDLELAVTYTVERMRQ